MNIPWTRRAFLQTGCLGVAAGLARTSQAQETAQPKEKTAAGALSIGSARQLFFDDYLIDADRTSGLTRTLNPPQKIERVLTPDQPWEALGFIFYSSVVDDGGTAKLYLGSYDAEKKKHFGVVMSQDGLHWERPQLGLKAYQGSKANNLLPMEVVEACVFLDPHAPPEKRYRMIFTRGFPDPSKAGVSVASSSDGVHWNALPERLLPFLPDSQPSGFWDERLQKYVIYLRAWNPDRTICRVEVSDLEKPWPYDQSVSPFFVWGKDKIPTLSRELPKVLGRDDQDQEHLQLYTSAVELYAFAPDVYVAFPAAYQYFSGAAWESKALPKTNDGTFDVQFATSRDGVNWRRWREPYVSTGLRDGLDLRLVSMGCGMIRRGPWLHQYFVGWPYTHGMPVVWDRDLESRAEWMAKDRGGIYCATQRVDGFVSMNATNSGGTLTTRPLVFEGNRLRLNLHTAGSGSSRVALLDAQGQPLAGFTMEDCEIISDDAIDYEVRWRSGADVGALAGQSIRVQVTMRNAKLYALQFASVS